MGTNECSFSKILLPEIKQIFVKRTTTADDWKTYQIHYMTTWTHFGRWKDRIRCRRSLCPDCRIGVEFPTCHILATFARRTCMFSKRIWWMIGGVWCTTITVLICIQSMFDTCQRSIGARFRIWSFNNGLTGRCIRSISAVYCGIRIRVVADTTWGVCGRSRGPAIRPLDNRLLGLKAGWETWNTIINTSFVWSLASESVNIGLFARGAFSFLSISTQSFSETQN